MTTGSTSTSCDGSRNFIIYASTTFITEIDNGKYMCYRSVDAVGNIRYLNSTPAIAGIDTTAPV